MNGSRSGVRAGTVVVAAPAKMNLFLRVLGRRPDGYHDLETLVVPLDLADRLEVHAHADPTQFRTLSLALEISGEPRATRGVPPDESNLALRAAAALAEAAGILGFAEIALHKRVPAAAGLGGGSSDAAATLRALNGLWGCALPAEELSQVAARVGSDVPALLAGRPVLARGRGENVEPVVAPRFNCALAAFDFGVSTADAFRWWDEDGAASGPDPGPALAATGDAAERGGQGDEARGDPGPLAGLLFNDLEEPVMRRHPEVYQAKSALLAGGAFAALMCGSGPSVIGLLSPRRARLTSNAEEELAWLCGNRPLYVISGEG